MSDEERVALESRLRPALRNWNGIEVGGLRPTPAVIPGDRRETQDP
jgi:hypothetical protein